MKNEARELDSIFEALANKHRRAIVHYLSLQPASISELASKERLSLPRIHKHIKVLEGAKFLRRKKNGRCNFLALDRSALLTLQNWTRQYQVYWGNNKESLENYISEINKKNDHIITRNK